MHVNRPIVIVNRGGGALAAVLYEAPKILSGPAAKHELNRSEVSKVVAIDDKPENDRAISAILLQRIKARPRPLARLVEDRRCVEPTAKIGVDAA